MIRRSHVLALTTTAALVVACVFSEAGDFRPSAIIPTLPLTVDSWQKKAEAPSQKVLDSLGSGTEYEQALFYREVNGSGSSPQFQLIRAFIVTSGSDMNSSIHRPERCFPAQGFRIEQSGTAAIELGNETGIDVTRLVSSYNLNPDKSLKRISYYWFVGHDSISHRHSSRAIQDIKDRVVGGFGQQWAYVMLSTTYSTEESADINSANPDLHSAEKILAKFTAGIFPDIHDETKLRKGIRRR